eukprot:2039644-Rhodomonas_salina.1
MIRHGLLFKGQRDAIYDHPAAISIISSQCSDITWLTASTIAGASKNELLKEPLNEHEPEHCDADEPRHEPSQPPQPFEEFDFRYEREEEREDDPDRHDDEREDYAAEFQETVEHGHNFDAGSCPADALMLFGEGAEHCERFCPLRPHPHPNCDRSENNQHEREHD